MNLTDYFIKQKTVSWMVTLMIIGGGIISFLGLGRLEDPEFTIKEAVVVTSYPGASAQEVEEEVTLPIENAIQQLPYVENIRSISSNGLSQVTVEMKSIYRKKQLAQIWDEMRRKINDMKANLPPGVNPPQINDDHGDVFGMFMGITGKGYSHKELSNYVDFLRRELVLVKGVGKVIVGGKQQEQIVLEVNRAKLTSLNISVNALASLFQNQNLVSNAGNIKVNSEYIRINSTGAYATEEELYNILLGQANGQLIYLRDIATVKQTYADPPRQIYRFNGDPALMLGISFFSGVNVVEVGKAVERRIAELESERPIGVNINVIYNQPKEVENSVNGFLVGLGQAIIIVIVVLLIAMGVRAGILMSAVLLLTILATFIIMKMAAIDLHRISLGALIIALGMLVDNAIVVTEGILVGIQKGLTRIQAAQRIVSQTKWALFGATIIAVTAFAPIGLSPDASGEFTGALFWVLFISLALSWIIAITLTPFFACLMFQENKSAVKEEETDPYKGVFYQIYKGILVNAIRYRWATVLFMIGLMASAIYGFRFVNQAFFPPSNLPLITVDYWLPEGSDIRSTSSDMANLEKKFLKHPHIKQITTTVGQGAIRFMLTYAGERTYASYGQFLIKVDSFENVPETRKWVDNIIRNEMPQAFSKSNRINIGPATKAKIEARLTGPDTKVLRKIAGQIMDVMHSDPDAINIRHDWRERTKVLRPQFAEADARRLGISKSDVDNAIALNVSGVRLGLLRDGSNVMPIILRPPANERSTVNQLQDIQIFSNTLNRYVNIDQVVKKIDLAWEDPLIMRRDRKRTVQVWADPDPNGKSTSFALFARLKPKIEAVELPPGYNLSWGGEYDAQRKANAAVFEFVPLGIIVMIAITVLLFNSGRQALVVWLTVPLAIIGVTAGLLLFNEPFSFTALLGFLSLSGMLLKNGIVLVEEINRLDTEENQPLSKAIVQASVSRLRPVVMAAITTILGLIPLLPDVFFAPLAVTIMFGLGFATVLTLIVVPVLFSIIYAVPAEKTAS